MLKTGLSRSWCLKVIFPPTYIWSLPLEKTRGWIKWHLLTFSLSPLYWATRWLMALSLAPINQSQTLGPNDFDCPPNRSRVTVQAVIAFALSITTFIRWPVTRWYCFMGTLSNFGHLLCPPSLAGTQGWGREAQWVCGENRQDRDHRKGEEGGSRGFGTWGGEWRGRGSKDSCSR